MGKTILFLVLALAAAAAMPWIIPGEEDPTWQDSVRLVAIAGSAWVVGFFLGRRQKASKK